MKTKTQNSLIILVLSMFLLAGCITFDIGKKPDVLTMQDVKSLTPADLADFVISLYNKKADWYRDQMSRVTTLSLKQQQQLVDDYAWLTVSWPIIDLYDRLVIADQPVDDVTRIEIYRFIEQYLGRR